MLVNSQNNKYTYNYTIIAFVLIGLILYQLISVFIGLDVCDAGYYLTFYDNIFSAPETVEQCFMVYFSGVVCGIIQLIFPHIGLLGFRIAGLVCNTLIMLLLIRMYKSILTTSQLCVGLILVVVTYVPGIYTLNYDLISVLLYLLIISLMYKGLHNEKSFPFFLAGVVVSLNVFTRLPNILSYFMIFCAYCYHFFGPVKSRLFFKQSLFYNLGFGVGLFSVIAFMSLFGHLDIYINVLKEYFHIGLDSDYQSSHNVLGMIRTQSFILYRIIKASVLMYIPIFVCYIIRKKTISRLLINLSYLTTFVAVCYVVTKSGLLITLMSLCAIAGMYLLLRSNNPDIRILSLLGLFMMFVYPLGSDCGAYNNGSIIAWCIAPLSMLFYDKRINYVIILSVITMGVVSVFNFSAFDSGPVFDKSYPINTRRLCGIYTTKNKADILNDLLKGISGKVKKGDTLLVYGSMPLINYVTCTKPYQGVPWPEVLECKLWNDKMTRKDNSHPIILQQKFNSLDGVWRNPSDSFLKKYAEENSFQMNAKLDILNQFVEANNYRIIYEDKYFVMYN